MSLEALFIVVEANIIAAPPVRWEHLGFPGAFPPGVAESLLVTSPAASAARRASPDYPTSLHYEAMPSPDMVLRLGNRRMGPELELGAFGGGRARAAGLVHVVIGFDF